MARAEKSRPGVAFDRGRGALVQCGWEGSLGQLRDGESMVEKRPDRGAWRRSLIFLGVILLILGGCTSSSQPGDTLTYRLPTAITINVGQSLPGTQIIYEGQGENGANVLINGQRALKRKGDSLNWKGDLLDGVAADLSLRVAWYTEDATVCGGYCAARHRASEAHSRPDCDLLGGQIRGGRHLPRAKRARLFRDVP